MANTDQTRELIQTQTATYEVTKLIATGSFSSIYKAKRESDGKLFAIKCESAKMKCSLLRQASLVLVSLQYLSPFFSTVEERGSVENSFLLIVMPLYGENLHNLMKTTSTTKKFSTSTTLHLAEQTLSAIRDLHRNGFVHRDIKPAHFCIGREEENLHHRLFLLDFGMCRRARYRKSDGSEEGIEEQLKKGTLAYVGVLRYASLAGHSKKSLGYKDDMESWWYMILEFFNGALPWSMLNKSDAKTVEKIKKELTVEKVSQFWKETPEALAAFFEVFDVVRTPKDVEEFVDYDRIAEILNGMFEKAKANPLEPPDWDCMVDYKGPAYEKVNMVPAQSVVVQEAAFGESKGGEKLTKETESAMSSMSTLSPAGEKSSKSSKKNKSMKVLKKKNNSSKSLKKKNNSSKSLKKNKSSKSIKKNKSSKSIKKKRK